MGNQAQEQKLSLLIIDDHTLFRAGIKILLLQKDQVNNVIEAESIEQALNLKKTEPSIIFLDINLQESNGLHAISHIKQHFNNVPVVMLSSSESEFDIQQAIQLDADGFLHKSVTSEQIFTAIDSVLAGNKCFPELNTSIIHEQSDTKLTLRQIEVLGLICKGLPNKLIARELDLSENTVRAHVSAILSILNVSSRTEAVALAKQGRFSNSKGIE